MAFDAKTATPDTSFAWATAGFIGADSQAATDPSYFPASDVRTALLALATAWAVNGAASTPAALYSGTWFTGGSATTTKPQVLIEPAGATSTGWSTAGTGFGVNAPSGFTGNLLDLQLNGARNFAITSAGDIVSPSAVKTWTGATAIAFDFATYHLGTTAAGARVTLGGAGGAGGATGVKLRSDYGFIWSSTTAGNGTTDTGLVRAAVATVKVTDGGTGGGVLNILRTVVASLPSAATVTAGSMAIVTDATAPTIGSNIAGGGAIQSLVVSNGTNWLAA